MVESNPHASNSKVSAPDAAGGKKKNKKKKAKSEANENLSASQQHERMVTLKNPMFNNGPAEPINSMMRNIQTPPFVSPMAEPNSASIVRNENGMYTIRNPSFQNAFGGGNAPAPAFVPRSQVEATNRPFSSQFTFENDTPAMESAQPKCSSVIGSEMKTVLQRRKEQEFAANNTDHYDRQYGMRQPVSTYSHFGGPGVNFNNNGTNCDDTFMSKQSSNSFQTYQSPMMSNYDDLRLQPGQMLNSEVSEKDWGSSRSLNLNYPFSPGHNTQRHRVENLSKPSKENSTANWNPAKWQH